MNDWIIQALCSLAFLVVLSVAYRFSPPRSDERCRWQVHAVTLVGLVALCVLLPATVANYIFTPLTATLAGTVFPIYESVRAVCSPDEEDDKIWLQYWLLGGVLFMATGWVGHVVDEFNVYLWYEITTIFYVWLFYPLTDGAALIYERVTSPLVGPHIKQLNAKVNNFVQATYQLFMNAAHLWLVWIVFVFLPTGLKRAVAIAVGTVYPLISSMAAASTEEVADDTYWLTYWSVYGCLFLIMDVLETYLGWIPGFYMLVIFTTVYLMLPMFQGADKLFRNVLVPLAGLQELLLLRDAIQVKKQMLLDLDPERARAVRQAIAKFYADDEATTIGRADLPEACKKEYLGGWRSIRLPFSRRDTTTDASYEAPNATTPIV